MEENKKYIRDMMEYNFPNILYDEKIVDIIYNYVNDKITKYSNNIREWLETLPNYEGIKGTDSDDVFLYIFNLITNNFYLDKLSTSKITTERIIGAIMNNKYIPLLMDDNILISYNNKNIKELIKKWGISKLCNSLKYNKRLKRLIITDNIINDINLCDIAKVLQNNKTLEYLDISNNIALTIQGKNCLKIYKINFIIKY